MTHNFKLTLTHTILDNNVEVEQHPDISVDAVVTDQDYKNLNNFNIDLDRHLFKVMIEELYKKYIEEE